jgi:hypothetical protein
MKLHTNVNEKTKGLLFKKKYWEMDYQIELTDEERALIEANPEVKKLTLAAGIFHDNFPIDCSVGMAMKGSKGAVFNKLANQTDFEANLREGCKSLKSHLDRLREVSAGPRTTEF